MPSGFQTFTDSRQYQIDSDYIAMEMVRSGLLTTQGADEGSMGPSYASVPVFDGEVLAISSSEYAAVTTKEGNTAYISTDRPNGTQIKYYVFAKGSSGANSGFQTFTASGELSFSSSWKLFNVVALMGDGDLTLPAGRQYASVQSKIASEVNYDSVVLGQRAPPWGVQQVRRVRYTAVAISGNNVSQGLRQVASAASALTVVTSGFRPSPASFTENNGVTGLSLILDVTGF